MDGVTQIVKRGKERQTPKKKKPTLLKKVGWLQINKTYVVHVFIRYIIFIIEASY